MRASFLNVCSRLLLTREAEHCLILGLLDGLLGKGDQWGPAPPLMALAEKHGEVILIALMETPAA